MIMKKQPKRKIVYKEIAQGGVTPLQAYAALAAPKSSSFHLDVVEEQGGAFKTYSYLGFNPIATFSSKNGVNEISFSGEREHPKGAPYTELRKFIKRFGPSDSSHPLFADAFFGFVAYDAIRILEKLPDSHSDVKGVPDLLFTHFGTVLIFDHQTKKITIAFSVENEAEADFEGILQKIGKKHPPVNGTKKGKEIVVKANMSDAEYCTIVKQAQDHIDQGDIFQIVLSRTFTTPITSTPLQIHAILDKLNPSPYMFLFETEQFAVIGASPEKLVSVINGHVETVPVGGTQPKNPHQSDQEVAKILLANPKEVAEHNMKMEVGRNDIGAVTVPGSVFIKELRGFRIFSHVIHIVTRIGGTLRKDRDCLDAIQAILPAATLSGSPKIRALELIDKFEKSRRGIYGGAICLLDARGNLNSCITIRTLFIKDGIATVRAGAGVVAYSDPQYEANETRHKAQAALEALRLAEQE